MSKVLYRAKTRDNGQWVYGYYIKYGKHIHKIKPIDKEGNAMVGECTIDILTLGEFTGLTDKNGNEIFEGDIVSLGDLSAVKICGSYSILHNDKQARYSLFSASGIEQAGFNQDTMKQYNIVGNIYDNLELLEERK